MATPRCSKCRQEVDVLRVQLTGKKQGVWKCNKCNTKHVQLVRIFGGWPSQAFKDLSEAEQEAFWAATTSSAAEVQQQVQEFMKKRRVEMAESDIGGTYLPLSVYKMQGYDTEAIEANCKDKREHSVLGMTYKVKLESEHHSAREELEREQVLATARTRKQPSVEEDLNESSKDKKDNKDKTHKKTQQDQEG